MRSFATIFMLAAFLSIAIPGDCVAAKEICFPEKPDIRACFTDPFSSYWDDNGGLPVFGYPLGNAQNERNPDLNVDLLTQWTERNRLEVHPENQPPFNILLGRMGAERLSRIGRDPTQEGRESGPQSGCLWFETTGHNVCDQGSGVGFMTYWQAHGLKVPGLDTYGRSLQLFGYPLTSPRMETNTSGDTVLTQWFERARFEWHPDKSDEFKVLLGLLGNELRGNATQPAAPSIFGAEIVGVHVTATVGKAVDANLNWIRYSGIVWSDVESTPGARNWAKLTRIDSEIKTLSSRGLTPMVLIHGTPGWAQQVPGSSCGPIKQSALDDFARFISDVVARYSGPPYNVKYWEIWNEPDIDVGLVSGDSGYGCWGDVGDPYYGGGYYAEMLKKIYPAMKQADPSAQLIVGGLLLDCDPANPPTGKDCKPSKFLEGILRNGGGNALDIIAYHAYSYWFPGTTDWDREVPAWKARGGVLQGKRSFINEVQSQYGIHKPILLNEAGLLCYPGSKGCPGDTFAAAQANYAVRMYTRSWAAGLLGAIWYTLDGPGWRDGGLLDQSQNPRPAYTTVKFLSNLLKNAVYSGPLGSGALEGYEFHRGSATYQVYWTNDSSSTTVSLPAGTRAVYDKFGQVITPGGTSASVGFEPIVIEIGSH